MRMGGGYFPLKASGSRTLLQGFLSQLGLLSLLQIVGVHGIEVEGLDSDGESDLLLLLQLLLGLGHLTPGISSTTTNLLGATSASLVGLLSLKHLLRHHQ